jgi:hypothetical protein
MTDLRKFFEGDYPGQKTLFNELVRPIFTRANDATLTDERELSDGDRKQIKSFKIFAQVRGAFPITFADVELNDSVVLKRSRVKIQHCVKKTLQTPNSCAIIFFHFADSKKEWRVSFVKVADSQKNSTSAKRFTYLCGKEHSCRTIAERFQTLKDLQVIKAQDLTDAFGVSALSEEFFSEYREKYADLVEFISGKRFVKKGGKFVEEKTKNARKEFSQAFGGDDKLVRDYVKKMMGRLVFLQFLQKKGWLGVDEKGEWGSGDKNFLYNLFLNSAESVKNDFLEQALKPLFFDTLNRDGRRNDIAEEVSRIYGKKIRIPYLNGGLFEEDTVERNYKKIQFGKKHFQDIFEFFNRYNFTIDETDMDEMEIGVDPEMLGKIFENLLEDNKDKGAFYTPKEIVQYMCRESLTAYLAAQTKIDEKKLREFVASEHECNFTQKEKADVYKSLLDVKICDPAVGSGAFPMGMMNELLQCHIKLTGGEKSRGELKRHIVKNNIYGVDIEKGAVDIARLRFWLAIVVDEEKPLPLPNLDYKIMLGNSLLESYSGIDLGNLLMPKKNDALFDSPEIILQLTELFSKNFEPRDYEAKEKIRTQIRVNIMALLRESCNNQEYVHELEKIDLHATPEFFLWHTWFYDVFKKRNGFDIVIGNPPYGAKISETEKKYYKEHYKCAQTDNKKGLKGSTDTFTVFIEMGHDLLATSGNLAFIVPMSVTSSDAMTSLHAKIESDCSEIRVSSYSNRPQQIFDAACVRTSILMLRKDGKKLEHLYTTKLIRRNKNTTIKHLIDNLEFVDSVKLKTPGRYAKVGTDIEAKTLLKCFSFGKNISSYKKENGKPFYYRCAGGRYWNVVANYSTTKSSSEKFMNVDYANLIGMFLSSSVFYFYQQIYTDGLNLKQSEIENFPLPDFSKLKKEKINLLEALYNEYLRDIEKNANIRTSSENSTYNVSTFKEYKIVKSYSFVEKIDDEVCKLYGLSAEETNFIKNYELEARMAGAE